MTPLERILRTTVSNVLGARWNFRVGRVIPTADSILLQGGSVELDCTFLYADLAESSGLATEVDRRIASKVVKCFLTCACRLVAAHQGQVVSFDGDRVMAIFVGSRKNTNAAKVALRLNYVVKEIITPRLRATFDSLYESGFEVGHATGVDTGIALAIRTGLRNVNDVIWVGRAPNVAARLSELRSGSYSSYISAAVHNGMLDEAKFSNGEPMWERRTLEWTGENLYIYRSRWTWAP